MIAVTRKFCSKTIEKMTREKKVMEMRNDYCVGDLVYDAKLYDGLND